MEDNKTDKPYVVPNHIPASKDEIPLLDKDVIDDLRLLSDNETPDIINVLIDHFFENTPPSLEKMAEGIKARNYQLIRGEAHNLKSSAANFGAKSFAMLCKALEYCAIQQKGFDQAAIIFEQIVDLYPTLQAALQTEMKESTE